MRVRRRRTLALLAATALLVVLELALSTQAQVITWTDGNSNQNSTSFTCQVEVQKGNVIYVAVSSVTAPNSVTDNIADTYLQATGTTSIWTAVASGSGTFPQQITITVHFASTTVGGGMCISAVGWSATDDFHSSGSWANGGTNGTWYCTGGPQCHSVASFSPVANDLVVSDFIDVSCGTGTPSGVSGQTRGFLTLQNFGSAGTCNYGNNAQEEYLGFASYTTLWPGGATTQAFGATTQYTALGCNHSGCVHSPPVGGGSAEAASFPENTIVSQSITDTATLAIGKALANPSLTETLGLTPYFQLRNPSISEVIGISSRLQPAQASFIASTELCVFVYVNNINTLYFCQGLPQSQVVTVTSGTVINPNPGQPFYWWFPLMVIGMFTAIFLGIGGSYRVSPRGLTFLFLTGFFTGSIGALMLQIVSFYIPGIALFLLIVYSLRVRSG